MRNKTIENMSEYQKNQLLRRVLENMQTMKHTLNQHSRVLDGVPLIKPLSGFKKEVKVFTWNPDHDNSIEEEVIDEDVR